MRTRTLVAIVALLSVVLHAGAVVRHNGIMVNAHLLEQLLGSAVAICHGGPGGASRLPAGFPGVPKPSQEESGCPVCAGHAPASALSAPEFLGAPVRFVVIARWREPERTSPVLGHAVWPPARGPPASVRSV